MARRGSAGNTTKSEPSAPRERDATPSRRAAIIAATITVLMREGLVETTTRKIAAEAGVNQAMIGYYFGGKDDLLFAALQAMMATTASIARSTMTRGVEPERVIARAIKAFWDYVERESALQIMQYELTLYALRRPDSAWLAREQYSGYTAVVADLAREAYELAERSCALPYDQLARFIVGGLDGLILQFVSDRDNQRARRDLGILIRASITLASGSAPQSIHLPDEEQRGAV